MQFKLVPEPAASVDRIAEVQSAVPLVPDEETSCCRRLVETAHLDSETEAREWLTFLRALRLAEETGGSYRRLARPADPEELREAFESRVYPAGEVRAILVAADGPLSAETTLQRLEARTGGGRSRLRRGEDGLDSVRQVGRVLEWGVRLGLVCRTDGGYAAE